MDILKPRCPICDWPLKATLEEGCIEGNCSYRPDQGSPEHHRIQQRRLDVAIAKDAEQTRQKLRESLRQKSRS